MLDRIIFNRLTLTKKREQIKNFGVSLGTRTHQDRCIYLYMLHSFFIEVIYENDDVSEPIEDLQVFSNYEKLDAYLIHSKHHAQKA